jgi:hypothetical protein
MASTPISEITLEPVQWDVDPFTNISLFIPRVFINITWQEIVQVFNQLRIGKVSRVDFQKKRGRDGRAYHSVFVHFEYWYDNVAARNFQARVLDPLQEARLVYDDPWHWIVLENNWQKNIDSY